MELREIRDAVASPVSRFDARSIWDGGKRAVKQGRMLKSADEAKARTGCSHCPSGSNVLKQEDNPHAL